MTLDLSFGVAVEYEEDGEKYTSCEWPHDTLPEDDGCGPQRMDVYEPSRSLSWGTTGDWFRSYPEIAKLFEEHEWNGSNDDFDVPFYVAPVLARIEAIPLRGDDYEADRTRWFKFWAKRSVEEYGDQARLMLS
jgi:hypothetical protein